jgi:hypothetical protein
MNRIAEVSNRKAKEAEGNNQEINDLKMSGWREKAE